MERELIQYPDNFMLNCYFQVINDGYLDIRYMVRPRGEIRMWIGSVRPTYRSFESPDSFKKFVKGLDKAVEELDAMRKDGLI